MQHHLPRDVAVLAPERARQARGIAERGDLLQHDLVLAVAPTVQRAMGLPGQLARRALSAREFRPSSRKCGGELLRRVHLRLPPGEERNPGRDAPVKSVLAVGPNHQVARGR